MVKKYLPTAGAPGEDNPRRIISSPPLEIHLSRSADHFSCEQLKEPELIFGENGRCVDPRTGLAAYGPYGNAEEQRKGQLRVGIVGTAEDIDKARSALEKLSRPIEQDSNLDTILYPSFPGLHSGKPFSVDVISGPSWVRTVGLQELHVAQDCTDPIAKFEMLREIFGAQIRAMSALEPAPNVAMCALPGRMERSLFQAACAQSLPIEIVGDERLPETVGPPQDKATGAWNLAVRLLHKAGVTPWRLAQEAKDACFVGISLHRKNDDASCNRWVSIAHAVTEHGPAFALMGETIERNADGEIKEAPNLDREPAEKLLSSTLEAYKKMVGRMPRKVVVHKAAAYTEKERLGFGNAVSGIAQHALVSLGRSGVFFLRPGRHPVPRGSAIPFGEKLGIVYLSGYVPFLRCYPGNRLPQPFEITENWGSLPFLEIANDLLRLTKLDRSSSAFCSEEPVTMVFSAQAANVLRILGRKDIVLDDRFFL